MASERRILELLEAIAKHEELPKIARSAGISAKEAQRLIRRLMTMFKRMGRQATLIIDGASKGNPGPAGAGAVLIDAEGWEIDAISTPLGIKTNNEAEYLALIHGLRRAKELGLKRLKVLTDSELMLKQMRGEYQIKSKKILPLAIEANRLIGEFEEVRFEKASRTTTSRADKLAKNAARMGAAKAGGR